MKPGVRIRQQLKQIVITLCVGSMVCGNSYALAQSVQSILHQGRRDQYEIRQDTYFTYDIRGDILTKAVDGKKTVYIYNTINQLIQIQKSDRSIINLKNDYDVQH